MFSILLLFLEIFYLLDGLVQRAHLSSKDIDRKGNSKANGYYIDYDSAGRRWEGNVGAVIYVEQKPNCPEQKNWDNNKDIKFIPTFEASQSLLGADNIVSSQIFVADGADIPNAKNAFDNKYQTYNNDG